MIRNSSVNISLMRNVSIIVAVDEGGGFGKNGKIPWADEPFAKEDFKHFQKTTKGGMCIMGRRTYEDMAEMADARNRDISKFILPNRECFVITKSLKQEDVRGATIVPSLRHPIEKMAETDNREIFVLGGEKLYIEALAWCNTIHMTIIKGDYNCDRHFDVGYVDKYFKIAEGEEHEHMYFVKYYRTHF